MLKYVKGQIKELLHTVAEAKQDVMAVIGQAESAGLMNILADIQDAAAAVGGRIEEAEGLCNVPTDNGTVAEGPGLGGAEAASPAREAVALLEKFCELLWKITQEQDMGEQQALAEEAWEIWEAVGRKTGQIPEQRAMVFMPYKASMWDSLESVWLAACRDPECVPFVVPIPYFDLKDGEMTVRHYEGEKFPDYVPVVHYSEFPLEEIHPDAVFIHNPFDDCNTVTTVLPQFYSGELKKAARRVVYIPYFITGDGVYVTHRHFPSYEKVDFIVTQCEKTIDSFAAELSREKFLPFGSPIADRVLRLEREKPDIPEEWKAQLKNGKDFGGDRAVMLNTSITMMMGQRERFLDKLEYLMELAKRQKGISLVWRPHPLLAATAKNMGEEYAARLAGLEEKFLREKIGVLDKTPDVGITVALCDAYLGETASSVHHMFGIAGKPRFYINMRIWEDAPGRKGSVPACNRDGAENPGKDVNEEAKAAACAGLHGTGEAGRADGTDRHEDDGNRMFASAGCRAGNKEYFLLDRTGWIVEKDAGTEGYIPVARIPGRESVRGRAYRGMELREGCLWLYPENAEGIFIYHIQSGRMRKIFERGEGESRDSGNFRDGEAFPAAPGYFSQSIEVDEECLSVIRAEKFKRRNGEHVWYEGEDSRADDFFRFLQTAADEELTGVQGPYPVWLANLDGSCGEKVLQAVKESCAEER